MKLALNYESLPLLTSFKTYLFIIRQLCCAPHFLFDRSAKINKISNIPYKLLIIIDGRVKISPSLVIYGVKSHQY